MVAAFNLDVPGDWAELDLSDEIHDTLANEFGVSATEISVTIKPTP